MQADKSTRIVANWIFLGIAMLIIQVLLGGITRLTGSGLSITEWKPLMGALPPMNEAQWQKAFNGYQQIAQFKYLNRHFSLSDFKFIFFWEWFHRLWARIIGVVFLIPFTWFLIKGYFKSWMVVPLVILFLLGALQGAIGWIMVQSGLNDNDLYVSHIRLAVHFMAAMILIGYALIFGLKLSVGETSRVGDRRLLHGAIIIAVLVCIQLIFGAFMAGLKAATAAPTWPDINGMIIPAGMFGNGGFFHNVVHNKITIHFIHRTLAYIIAVSILIWWLSSRKNSYSSAFNKAKNLSMFFVIAQIILGVLTVLNSRVTGRGNFGAFEWLAQLHQLTGMLLFLSLIAVLYLLSAKRTV
ncbi:MAG: COX15/CtaA family protein [Segetibacter sp.]|nr:COX15/CtaA family protein [Segetibacter sp.]